MAKPIILAEVPSLLRQDHTLDLPAVVSVIHRLIDAGYTALIVAGTAGEYENLTLTEHSSLISAAVSAAEGKAAVIAGAFELGTAKAAARIREHAAMGCHQHLCIPAHYFGFGDPGELQLHFRTLAETGEDVIILDSAEHVGYLIPEDVRRKLLTIPGVKAIACHAANVTVTGHAAILREELYLSGVEARAIISRLAFLFPNLCRQEHLKPATRQLMLQLLAIGRHPAVAVKHAARYLGLCACSDVLPPFAGLSAPDMRAVESICSVLAEEERLYHA